MAQATTPAGVCVLIATDGGAHAEECLESIHAHTPTDVPVAAVQPSISSLNRAIADRAPADVIVLLEPCRVSAGWLERLGRAARADTNTATASALADTGSPLALAAGERPTQSFSDLAAGVAEHSLALRPRLGSAVGPCIYVRRDAIDLVGPLDERLDVRSAIEVDFAQRCILCGLAHVAADDVVVERLGGATPSAPELLPLLLERYPHLSTGAQSAASAVLERALQAARRGRPRLGVTIDARGLEGALTGTRLHALELVRALAHTDALQLRLLVRGPQIDDGVLGLLGGLPATEILSAGEVGGTTPRTAVVHRPQQTFSSEDVRLAYALGERVVISQLDLIAYRNPGYFPNAEAWVTCRRAIRMGLVAADRAVVFSEHTRDELISDALVEEGRVRVIPPGLDHGESAEPSRPAALDAGFGHTRPFLLCLGTDFRHKNRVFALGLLTALHDRHGWEGGLVFAGTHIPHGSSRELERAALEELPHLRDAVTDLGPVEEREKAWLMANAAAVVYPSVYEGFGLVPFESALSGVPCAFAPQSSLAEVLPGDGAGARIVPWDVEESAARVHELLSDEAIRERHVRALAEAARSLTWARTAEALVEVYEEAAIGPVRGASAVVRESLEYERELIAAHDALVERLVGEREHARHMYDALNAEVGSGLSLIGPHGALPEDLQNALLALSARPGVSRPLYGMAAGAFAAARTVARSTTRRRPRPR